MLVKSEKLQNGAVYAVKLSDKWLYTGGWDKVINIQVCLLCGYIIFHEKVLLTCNWYFRFFPFG
jgi:hypothetical protein